MLLVFPVVYLLLTKNYSVAFIIFIIAGLSDALDGFLAKQFNWVSKLGEILDPLADKLLMVSCYLVLGSLGYLPSWLVICVIFRDFIIVIGALIYYLRIKKVIMKPNILSKINTTAQILLICIVLFSIVFYKLPETGLNSIFILVFLTTLASGLGYSFLWIKKSFYS